MLTTQISKLGRSGVRFISAIGRATIMLFHALAGRPQPRKHFPLLVQQLYVVGYSPSPSYWCRACSSAWCSPCRATTY